jgi:hypothetical protein
MTILAVIVAAVVAALLVCRRRALLAWYLWEVRRRAVPEAASERIDTYPLA